MCSWPLEFARFLEPEERNEISDWFVGRIETNRDEGYDEYRWQITAACGFGDRESIIAHWPTSREGLGRVN